MTQRRSPPPPPNAAPVAAADPTQPPSPPGPDGKRLRRFSKATARRRRTRARPERGWGLIGKATQRLGLGEKLQTYLACRAFAVSLHRLLPRLEPHARAETLQDGSLTVRVSSSAVASELVYVKDLLLEQVNVALARLATQSARGLPQQRADESPPDADGTPPTAKGAPRRTGRGQGAAVTRFVWRVAPVRALPAFADWTAWTPRSTRKSPPRPPWDLAVAQEVTHVEDRSLRDALQALYAAATDREK